MIWPHKHLLSISQLSEEDIGTVFELGTHFTEVNTRSVKKTPTLKGKSVVLFFAEASTRTKTSFDMAAKRLSADTFSLASSGSSLQKGENLKDTGLTLQAMYPDLIVIRHEFSGAASFLAKKLDCSIVNAGDGWHAHPTQALLDGFTLSRVWDGFSGKTLLLLGDIAHSRVARSDVELFAKLGVNLRVCAPATLIPADISEWPVEVYQDLHAACRNIDAVQCLRLQLERQKSGLLPNLREYAMNFGLRADHLDIANPGVKILHPGPMNRGVEIQSGLADCEKSLILDQVGAGVSIRMALLYLFLTRSEQTES
ncbi:MAG: aspartate carbamoyltransferase catalytic subunit [Thermodesulfobacteriota bacterium]